MMIEQAFNLAEIAAAFRTDLVEVRQHRVDHLLRQIVEPSRLSAVFPDENRHDR